MAAEEIDANVRESLLNWAEVLAEGAEGVRRVGGGEFFEAFFDFAPHRDDGGLPEKDALSAAERAALEALSRVMDDAVDETAAMGDDAFIETPWPDRIAAAADAFLTAAGRRPSDGKGDLS